MIYSSFPNALFVFFVLVIGTVTSILGSLKLQEYSQWMMPKEYKVVKKIVDKLAEKNDLGNDPLAFTIISGSRVSWTAETLSLIKQEGLFFYRHINPFENYVGKSSEEINEAIRQAYLLNGIEAYAYPNGTIGISRSTFRSLKNKNDYLACIIGHEISHILNHDSFNSSLRKAKEGKKLKKKKKESLGYQISRETETNADINSAKMIIQAGFPKDTCLKALDFVYRHEGDGRETEKNSTHPGYEDRRKALEQFVVTYKEIEHKKEVSKGNWKYNRNINTLIFVPKYRKSEKV
tara:strand:+ start:974 stop:1849 length:876 start_codon:yes stop_codon:yes gene_type:complete